MHDIINQLPDKIANQIAAGEVIQRPASAVKELLENAIDAGATEIKLFFKDAGKTLIQVIDNGKGMSSNDARMCFERHATSKIKTADDLFAIHTMGFRGEALASIAAVSQVELKTRRPIDEVGTCIINEGFEVKSQTPCQTAVGTSFALKNLFFNVPARRNFLKSNPTETKQIIDEFQRIALAHPLVHFKVYNNDIEIFNLPSANLKQRIINLFGNNYQTKLVTLQEETTVCNIYGFIGTADAAKKTRGEQFFFVNNRFIRSNYLHHAVMANYKQIIAPDAFPLYVIFIDVAPERIDVNVHPTKQEIKFDDEKIIYSFINSAVKRALAQYSVTPSLDFETPTEFNKMEGFTRSFNSNFKNVITTVDTNSHNFRPITTSFPKQNNNQDWKELYKINNPRGTENLETSTSEMPENTVPANLTANEHLFEHELTIHDCFQFNNAYIIANTSAGVIIVDQQAAHERILFEKNSSYLSNKSHAPQLQLFPINVELTKADAIVLLDILKELKNIGFDIDHFGKESFVINGLPAVYSQDIDAVKVVHEILELYKNNHEQKLSLEHNLALSTAKSASIKSGMPLDELQIKRLITDLLNCQIPFITYSGRKTFYQINETELNKIFSK